MNTKHKLQYLYAILAFIVIAIVYFKPIIFDNKQFKPNDIIQGVSSGKEASGFREETGEEPLWSGTMFSGMPLYLTNTQFSGDLTTYIFKIIYSIPNTISLIFINFICFFVLMRVLKVKPLLCFLGAFAFSFTTFTMLSIEAGHNFKVRSIGFIPLVLAGFLMTYHQNKFKGGVLLAIAFALQLACKHYQITYYLAIILLVLGVNEFVLSIKGKATTAFIKSTTIAIIALTVGLGPNLGRILLAQEYTSYSIRGKSELVSEKKEHQGSGLDRDYAFSWSQGVGELLTLAVPHLYGGASSTELSKDSELYKEMRKKGIPAQDTKQFVENAPTYWGPQPFTGGPVYVGSIILFLFCLSLFALEKKQKIWWLAVLAFFAILATGKNIPSINYFLFDYLPAYNKFRTPAMALSVVVLIICTLSVVGLSSFFQLTDKEKQLVIFKKAVIASAILFALPLLIAFSSDFINIYDGDFRLKKQIGYDKGGKWLYELILEQRNSMFYKDWFRSIFFVLVSIVLVYLGIKKTVKLNYVLAGLCLFTIIDLVGVNKRYFNDKDFSKKKKTKKELVPMTQADQIILQDKSLSYRVLNLTVSPFNDATTSYYHKSIGGYHGAKLRRYQDVIEKHISQNNQGVLDMLNTKYLITKDPKQPVVIRPTHLGNAWFVDTILLVNSPDEELASLKGLNAKNTAVLDQSKFTVSQTNYSSVGSSITLTDYKPNHMTYATKITSGAFAVFSEIYYDKGWVAYIDGKETNYVRVNYILRGLQIPEGDHTVEFKFIPQSYFIGNKIALISSILLFGLVGVVLFVEIRKKGFNF
ncbi:MAG: YfhO family protein [Cyclobacteriaceae bacterium]